MFLAEKGVEIPKVEIDITVGAHKTPEYLAKTGMPHVPALELEDGTVLTESVAICRYIEALHPAPPLFGADPLEAAVIEMWHRRVELYLMLPIAQVFRHSNPNMAALEDQVPEWAEANRPRVLTGLAMLERRLNAAPFIGGARFSVADITAVVALDFMRVIRTPVPEEMTALTAWLEAARARPSVIWRR
jgi:glutathione S-transferase